MKKIWKKVLASVLAVTLCAGAFMATNWNTASAEDAVNPADSLEVSGASIRFVNSDTAVDGIRFAVRIKADVFAKLTDAQKKNYHLLVMPTALLTDGVLEQGETYTYAGGEAKAQDLSIDWSNADDETENSVNYKVVRIYLNQIDASYYMTDVTARAYYQDGTNAPVYSVAKERSYYTVASLALEEDAAGFTEVQRDALLGVKYIKTGTWDYVDGKLVNTSELNTDSLTDRTIRTEKGEYVLTTSFKTRALSELKNRNEGDTLCGVRFAYNPDTNAFVEFDYSKYVVTSGDTTTETLIPSLRTCNSSGTWGYIGRTGTVAFEPETWYDFKIIVNESDTSMFVRVMYRKSSDTQGTWADAIQIGDNHFATVPNYSDGAYGNMIQMYSGHNFAGDTYSPEIGYNEDYFVMQDFGRTVTATEDGLKVTGAKTNDRTQVVDLNNRVVNTGNNADFVLSIDMVWDDKSTDYWLDTGFQIGGYNMNARGSKSEMYFSPRGLRIYNDSDDDNGDGTVNNASGGGDSVWDTYALSSLSESISGLDTVIEKIAAGEPVTWTIEARTSGNTTTVKYYVDGILCVTENCRNTLMYSNYITYVATAGVTFSNMNNEIPEAPAMAQTTGAQSLKLDQTLNADGTGTIKGSFIHDFRVTGSNERREGIKFSGTNGNGYYFYVGAQPTFTTPRFYVGMWRYVNTDTFVGWRNDNMLQEAAKVPSYDLFKKAGIELKDNDEVKVDFEITISINDQKQKAFDITYTLSHETWSHSESWSLVDNRADEYYRGGSVYLCSEDDGDPNVANDNGDGKTIYNWVTVNGNQAKSGEPSSNATTMQTTGAQSLKLDQSLNADGTGTIKGQFIADYRTAGDNNRKEGIKFSGTNGNGYYFYVGAQPAINNGRFYVGMWRNIGTDTEANWNNTDMSDGARVPAYSLVTDAGEKLQDNDEIVVDFEITITITADNKKAFNITYTLSHGDWSCDGGWTLTDNRVGGYFTGGDVYLCSEDGGNPNVANDVGDGKTIYNWITVDDSLANLAN